MRPDALDLCRDVPIRAVAVERREHNVRRWPGRKNFKPHVSRVWKRRLRDRSVLIIGVVPALGVSPEQLGLGAWLVVLGGSILDAGIVVRAETDVARMQAWAVKHPVDTVLGPTPWRVLDLETFGHEVLARLGYLGQRPIAGIDLLRTFGLLADMWWQPGWQYPRFRNGFAFGLAGFGRVRRGLDGTYPPGAAGWSQDFGSPILRAATRGARSVQFEWGPARPYVKRTVDAAGAPIEIREQRGVWETDGRSYSGTFVELGGIADTFDGGEHNEPARHLVAYGRGPITPQAVRTDPAGAEHVTALIHASHQLMLAVDDEAEQWCPGLDLSHLWSAGTLLAELHMRWGVRPPLAWCRLSDDEIDAWCRITHGGVVRCERTTGLVPAEDRDIRHAYPAAAHLIDWWRYLTARSLPRVQATARVRAFATQFADGAARHDFEQVKRLLPRLHTFGCVRVVIRAVEPPFPALPIELHTSGAHGHMVIHPCAGERLAVTLADYLAAVVQTSAETGIPHIFDLIDAVRLVPVGRADKLQTATVLGEPIDATIDDPALVWTRHRAALKERGRPEDLRRAAVLRVLDNAGFGQLARFDGGGDRGAKPGPLCAPWLYASIVSIPRLLIAIVEADVSRRGGTLLAVDTDGVMLATSPEGGEPVVMCNGRQVRALSWQASDEVFAGFEALAVDDYPSLWDVRRDYDGRPLLGRSFNPKRYALGYLDGGGRFVIVKSTEHNLGLVGPPWSPGWTADVARIHAEHHGGQLVAEFGWDLNPNHRWPRLERVQLATWRSFNAVASAVGLRPGAHVLEAAPFYRAPHEPRPIAADPGGTIADPERLNWLDGHNGDPIPISTDAAFTDAVQVATLRGVAVDWGVTNKTEGLPDAIFVHPDDAHAVIRRGVALVETGEAHDEGVDESRLIVDAYRTLGAERFAQVTGITPDAAKKLAGRVPGTAKVSRIVASGRAEDPHAFARLADKVATAARRCIFDGCTEMVSPRHRYCSTHSDLVRREKNRTRMRLTRVRADHEDMP